MIYVGKLLVLKKKVIGFTTPDNSPIVNMEINKGCYLIIDFLPDKKSNNIFLEIIFQKKLVLIRVNKFEEIGFLC